MPSLHLTKRHPVDFPWWLERHGFSERDLERRISDQVTPLMLAARYGATEIASELIARGVSLRSGDARGNDALWMACLGAHLDTVELLCAAGADVDHQNREGVSALMLAAAAGYTRIVRHLVARGARVGLSTQQGWTAVDLAKTQEIVRLLVGQGTSGAARARS
jgi:ankyrin repeat protein